MPGKVNKGWVKGATLVLCIIFWGSLAQAVESPKGGATATRAEILRLYDRLDQMRQEEVAIEIKLRNAYRLASQPYSDYLIYQNGHIFQEYGSALEGIRLGKKEILDRLSDISGGEPLGAVQAPLRQDSREMQRYPIYSGAPMLSFNESRYFDARSLAELDASATFAYRILIGSMLLLILTLAGFGLYRMWRERTTIHNTVELFPLFRVRVQKNDKEVLWPLFRRRVFDSPKFWLMDASMKGSSIR